MDKKIKTVLQTTDGEIHQDAATAERHQARIDLADFITAYNDRDGTFECCRFIEDIVDNACHKNGKSAATFADLMKRAK